MYNHNLAPNPSTITQISRPAAISHATEYDSNFTSQYEPTFAMVDGNESDMVDIVNNNLMCEDTGANLNHNYLLQQVC